MESGPSSAEEQPPRLYRRIDVYERQADGTIAVYVCFEIVGTTTYVVQSMDYIDVASPAERVTSHCRQGYALFQEVLPDERMKACSTLAEAIKQFKDRFA
jgi:hypothetical protein